MARQPDCASPQAATPIITQASDAAATRDTGHHRHRGSRRQRNADGFNTPGEFMAHRDRQLRHHKAIPVSPLIGMDIGTADPGILHANHDLASPSLTHSQEFREFGRGCHSLSREIVAGITF
jgi:hypothetical protein